MCLWSCRNLHAVLRMSGPRLAPDAGFFLTSFSVDLNVIVQCIPGAVKGKVIPGQLLWRKDARLQRLVRGSESAADHVGDVDDDHIGRMGIRINIEQRAEPNLELRLLPGLANRRGLHAFAAVDIAARKNPLAEGGFDAAATYHGSTEAELDLVIDRLTEALQALSLAIDGGSR